MSNGKPKTERKEHKHRKYYRAKYRRFMEVLDGLPAQERAEYDRLMHLSNRSEQDWQRMAELVQEAWRLHWGPLDTWYDELVEKMWSRLTPEEAAYWQAEKARRVQVIEDST